MAQSGSSSALDRRQFLKLGGATAAALAAGVAVQGGVEPETAVAQKPPTPTPRKPAPTATPTHTERAQQAYQLRVQAAQRELDRPIGAHPGNGDEELYLNRLGNYSKALPHNALGEVDPGAYDALLRAVSSGRPEDFEAIPMGGTRKLTNPQAGMAFTLQGPDCHALFQPPAPAFKSAEIASEIAENYWMALARDIHFSDYGTNALTQAAAQDLSNFSDFRGPKVGGQVTAATLFRGLTPGDLTGPYMSQFMWMDTHFGAETIDRRMRTPLPGNDFMTSYSEWLAIQRGSENFQALNFDPTHRYIRNGRDLSEWVHIDVLFQGYFNALLILFSLRAPFDPGDPYRQSNNQIGFGTLGAPYIASVLCGVAKAALEAVWHQKWFVHRRIRPEEFAGRVHNHVTGAANYPISPEILNSPVLDELFSQHGTYLLPMAFPEGCPTHPAYGAGHGTVAGACTTILKAYFDESFVIPNPVVANADGTALLPFSGPDLTVGGELNKLASNVAVGRNIAGVHWRSDATESLKLGEEVAIRFLREEKMGFNERFGGWQLTKYNGRRMIIL